jgi:hypothetical protein
MEMKRRILMKILLIIGTVILAVCAAFYYFWTMSAADKQNLVSLITENAHTGLALAPLTQVAMGGNPPNSDLAQGNQKGANPASPGGAIAMGNPLVLFDISAQPIFGKNGISPVALLLIIFAIPALALFFLYLWDLLKKGRIKR